jgi:hypothetical protein
MNPLDPPNPSEGTASAQRRSFIIGKRHNLTTGTGSKS